MSDSRQAPASRDAPSGPSRFLAWCRLLRVPNLLTVPGDPIVGFVLAGMITANPAGAVLANLWPPVLAALCLYAAGLLANDYFDLAEDRWNRPSRPLPAGLVRPATALKVALGLVVMALGAASLAGQVPFILAIVLAACAAGYDAGLKRVCLLGPLTMGLCRALSLLLGAAAVDPRLLASPLILLPAGLLTGYIAAVTLIASGETRARPLGIKRWLPAVGMLGLLVSLNVSMWGALVMLPAFGLAKGGVITCALQILSAVIVLESAARLTGKPAAATVQHTVGRLIRILLLAQASIAGIMVFPFWLIGAGLVVAWPASALLARRFRAS